MKRKNRLYHYYYYFCLAVLSLGIVSGLAGCAPGSVLNGNATGGYYNNKPTGNISKLKNLLEKKIIEASLKLSGVPKKKIENVFPSKYSHRINAKNIGGYLTRSFIPQSKKINFGLSRKREEYADTNKNLKVIALNKTAKTGNGKIALKIEKIKFEKIFWIIYFSLKNLYPYPIEFSPGLFEKTGPKTYGYAAVPFKSNIGTEASKNDSESRNIFLLPGHAYINGEIIFLAGSKNLSGFDFGISVLYGRRHEGIANIVKLYKVL